MVVPHIPVAGEAPGDREAPRSPGSAAVALLVALVVLLAATTIGFGGAVVWLTTTAPDAFGTVYLDVTTYDATGNIIDRSPTLFTWRPGQTLGLISTLMNADLPSAALFVIEQTMFEEEAFDVTGELTLASVTVGEAVGLQAVADFALNSTLSRDLEVADVGILGFADGSLFAACVTPVDVPVGAVFADDCIWESVSSEFVPDAPPSPPADATYEVTLLLR